MNHLIEYQLVYLAIYLLGFLLSLAFFAHLRRYKHWVLKEELALTIALTILLWPVSLFAILIVAAKDSYEVRKLHRREFRR